MASPQKENGHAQIANEILEALARTPLPGTELRLVLHVLRKTYGYGKKKDWISISQFAEALHIDTKSVCRSKKRLLGWGVVEMDGNKIGLNKNWESWQVVASAPLAQKPQGSGVRASGKSVPEVVASAPHTKDNITKDIVSIIKKPTSKKKTVELSETSEESKAIVDIIEVFQKSVSPSINYGHRGHRGAAQRLVSAFGREKALEAAKYAVSVQSDKYAPVVTNPTELEAKYDKLKIHWQRENNPSGRGGLAIIG